jgi:hypothetical protein
MLAKRFDYKLETALSNGSSGGGRMLSFVF